MNIIIERQEDLAILFLNRPEVYHALNRELLFSLRTHLEVLQEDQEIRVIIITGTGEKAFCAGADLKERRSMSPEEVSAYLKLIRETFTMIETFPKPVIAAINGLALGGGTELALACDLRIMAKEGTMGLTETSLGIIPGAGGTQRLPRLIGKGLAKELIFTGRKIGGEEAVAIGLVNRLVLREELMAVVISLGKKIAANAPLALAQAKWAIDQGSEVSLDVGLALEAKAYEVLIPTKDRREGLLAFQEKRNPRYTGE